MSFMQLFNLNPCLMLSKDWLQFGLASVLLGLVIGGALSIVARLTRSGFGGNFAFGCLAPIGLGLIIGNFVRQRFGLNPGYCGATPDNVFLPIFVFLIVVPMAVATFFAAGWVLNRKAK